MKRLTQSAKKTLALLMLGNVSIIITSVILYQYLLLAAVRPNIPPQAIPNITKFVEHMQKASPSHRERMMNRGEIPWLQLSMSDKPEFPDNTVLNLKPNLVYDAIKKQKMLQVSIMLEHGDWLNLDYRPPQSGHIAIISAFTALIILWFVSLFLLNYWAIRRINQPMQALQQNLAYLKQQKDWQPLPLVGDEEQQAIFEKINQLQAKVNKLLQDRTHMLTAISHDLRTPLTRLKLRTEYLEGSEHSNKLMNDIDEMETMISETLDYFHDLSTEEQSQRFDFVAMLNAICEDAQDLSLPVSFNTDADKLIYNGSMNLLKRAFYNLINNAIHYGQKANVSLHHTEQQIEVSIEDEGEGIVDVDKAFVPFYRGEASRSRKTGGVGLGLSIAKEIIQKHNGTIQLNNKPEGGLRVIVILPIQRV